MNSENIEFWLYLDHLAAECPIEVDRPKGSSHPRFPEMIYPLDYGFLAGSTTVDGGGVDCWRGTQIEPKVVGAVLSVDLLKRDAEIKLLLGCDEGEIQLILNFMNRHQMRAMFLPRDY